MDDIDAKNMTDEELNKKENISLLFYLGCVLSVIGVNYLLGTILPNSNYKALITYLADLVIVILFLSGYLLYSWKSNMAELFKRIRIAIPLALFTSIFAVILFDRVNIPVRLINCGLFMLFLLLLKTPDCKQHFTVIMTLVLTFAIALKFLQFISPAEGEKDSYLRATLPFVYILPLALFFSFYMSKVIKGRPFAISSVMFKALKFFIAISVFLSLFMLLAIFGKEWGITLPIQLLASSLLSIPLVVVCYRLDLYPTGEKKKKVKCEQHFYSDVSFWSLLIANIVTIVWALKEGWSLGTMVWVYLLQGVILGFFWSAKVLASFEDRSYTKKVQSVVAFLPIYLAIHFIFATGLYSSLGKEFSANVKDIFIMSGIFLLSETISYLSEYSISSPKQLSLAKVQLFPYARIAPMYAVMLFGTTFVVGSSNIPLLTMFFLLSKAFSDIAMYMVERNSVFADLVEKHYERNLLECPHLNDKREVCQFCQRRIDDDETPWLIKEKVVCKECYNRIEEEKAGV